MKEGFFIKFLLLLEMKLGLNFKFHASKLLLCQGSGYKINFQK